MVENVSDGPENIGGNYYDKYGSRNPVARLLMQGFLNAFDELVQRAAPRTVYEIGCGEGHLSRSLLDRGIEVRGCDVEAPVVAEANALNGGPQGGRFEVKSVYDFKDGELQVDAIVCCEVLEHLTDPEAALDLIARQSATHFIFSVPREPIWRVLNMARCKYLSDLGNTPGHLQHWSSTAFKDMISKRFDILEVRRPLPWTMVLCRHRP